MLNILGMIILIIIFFIIILLAIGIKIIFKYNKNGSEFKGCLKILIFKKIKVYSLDFPSQDEEEPEDEEEEEEESEGRDLKKLFDLAKPCFEDIMDYLKFILETISVKKIQNHIIFGLESYADTGKYIGMIWGVLAIVNSMNKNLMISAEPAFRGNVLDACGENEFEFYPLKVLVPTIHLISKKEIRALIRGVLDG